MTSPATGTPADAELAFAGPLRLAELVRARQVTARELVELAVRRIEALDPRLNAFRTTRAERALAEADGLTDLDRPLAGVPFAVKDDGSELTGETSTRGTPATSPAADHDAPLVARLRAAGAIPVGVTNVPELMVWPWTATRANGFTRNPWDPSRTPGGSSGGSAAAVAAGLVGFATAGDGGGSIRIPAAACGLVGLKPSRGRMAGDGDWLGMAVSGTLARTVADVALLLDITHGAQPQDRYVAQPFDGSYQAVVAAADPGRLRIAVSRKPPPGLLAPLSADQRGAWERTGALLGTLGHAVQERSPAYGMAQLAFLQTWLRGIYESTTELPPGTELDRTTRQMAAAGRYGVPSWRRDQLLAGRARLTARVTALWDEVDVLVTPALARTAIAAEGGYGRPAPLAIDIAGRFSPFTPVFNLTGQPAMAVPAGFGADGLPLAVQLVGRPGEEHVLLALAAQLEAAAPWAHQRPPVS